MGVRILYGTQQQAACFYCSTSGWAFGPLFHEEGSMSADELARQFLCWLDTYTPSPQDLNALGKLRGWKHDPRELTEGGLESAYGLWLADSAARPKTMITDAL